MHLGKGLAEYTDPVEFFRRTYLTAGLRQLLTQAAQRISGDGRRAGRRPADELRRRQDALDDRALPPVLRAAGHAPSRRRFRNCSRAAGVTELPSVRRAVLVGTEMSPGQPEVKPDGTEVRTLWGEIAWQLGGAEGYATGGRS